MPTIKNKIKLCETSLSDFTLEQISGVPFYNRYPEMERVFSKVVPSIDFGRCFAQPYENKLKRVIEWYYVPGEYFPSRLSELSNVDQSLYSDAIAQRDNVINAIKSAFKNAGESERRFLNAALTGIDSTDSDTTTYLNNGIVLFGVWGMRAKTGRKMEDVIHEDVLDHRVFTINYQISGNGELSFNSLKRKYGHKLLPTDVPQVLPSEGWTFTKWEPGIPQGHTVTEDVIFTAVCENSSVHSSLGRDGNEENNNNPTDDQEERPIYDTHEDFRPNQYHIYFKNESGGYLRGNVEQLKNEGEKVSLKDIPVVIPEEEYDFIGWNIEPTDYEVHSDMEFVARFRKKNDSKEKHWWNGWFGRGGCLQALLNWLLLGLGLLLLLLLLWCFVFGKCHFNPCGCDCDDSKPVPVIGPDTDGGTRPVQNPCNTEQASGGEEGYMGYFDMGQQTGKFTFEYNTLNQPDSIIIYDGKGTAGKEIFSYGGGSSDWVTTEVEFHKRIVTVTIKGLESGTAWHFNINCPNN